MLRRSSIKLFGFFFIRLFFFWGLFSTIHLVELQTKPITFQLCPSNELKLKRIVGQTENKIQFTGQFKFGVGKKSPQNKNNKRTTKNLKCCF